MLSYSWLIPRAYTIKSFCLTNAITVFTWWWKSSDMEIPMSCYWAHQQHFVSSMICVEHPASVGNLCKHYLHHSFVKHMFGQKKWVPLIHVHLMQVAAINLRMLVLLLLESSQVGHARAKYAMVWQARYLHSICIPYHTKPLTDLFREKKFLHKS